MSFEYQPSNLLRSWMFLFDVWAKRLAARSTRQDTPLDNLSRSIARGKSRRDVLKTVIRVAGVVVAETSFFGRVAKADPECNDTANRRCHEDAEDHYIEILLTRCLPAGIALVAATFATGPGVIALIAATGATAITCEASALYILSHGSGKCTDRWTCHGTMGCCNGHCCDSPCPGGEPCCCPSQTTCTNCKGGGSRRCLVSGRMCCERDGNIAICPDDQHCCNDRRDPMCMDTCPHG